jgi:hypothetical protein
MPAAYRVLLDLSRQLERELNEAKAQLEVEQGTETCTQCGYKFSPSLIESGWCVSCIMKERTEERDTWRKVADELECALQNCSPMCKYLSQEWGKWTALRHQALAAYKLKGQ